MPLFSHTRWFNCVFCALQDEEVAMLSELSRLQEVVVQLEKHTADPCTLPPASEQVIADLKSSDSGWSFQTPPSSPSSLGSRKSSMCSISSLNSSSSGSSKSPSHPSHWHRSLSQVISCQLVAIGRRFACIIYYSFYFCFKFKSLSIQSKLFLLLCFQCGMIFTNLIYSLFLFIMIL